MKGRGRKTTRSLWDENDHHGTMNPHNKNWDHPPSIFVWSPTNRKQKESTRKTTGCFMHHDASFGSFSSGLVVFSYQTCRHLLILNSNMKPWATSMLSSINPAKHMTRTQKTNSRTLKNINSKICFEKEILRLQLMGDFAADKYWLMSFLAKKKHSIDNINHSIWPNYNISPTAVCLK